MATTKTGFARVTTSGSTISLIAVDAGRIDSVNSALGGTRLDSLLVNLAVATYAKNGAVRITFSGTTPKTLDLTDTTTIAQSYAGDTAFASFTQLHFYNDGAQSIKVAIGATNGASLPLGASPGGTDTPYLTIAAGAHHVLTFASAVTVDSTHKTLDLTPVSGGSLILLVGGA